MNDTQTILSESASTVANLISTTSWLLMDKDQRDAFTEDVVLSRYMSTTSDGIKLTPTWWAKQTGATANAVQKRVERLRAKASGAGGTATREYAKERVGGAASAVKTNPELADKLVEDDDVAAALIEAAARKLADKKKTQRRETGPRKKQTTGLEAGVILTSLDVISTKLDDVIEVADTQTEEVTELINNSLDVIEQKTELIRAKVNNDLDWDEANKKELA